MRESLIQSQLVTIDIGTSRGLQWTNACSTCDHCRVSSLTLIAVFILLVHDRTKQFCDMWMEVVPSLLGVHETNESCRDQSITKVPVIRGTINLNHISTLRRVQNTWNLNSYPRLCTTNDTRNSVETITDSRGIYHDIDPDDSDVSCSS